MSARWRVYLVRCRDGTLYTGVAVDVPRRLETHNRGRGARYTRGRGPVQLVAQSAPMSRADALRLEARIKRLPRAAKADAVEGAAAPLAGRPGAEPGA